MEMRVPHQFARKEIFRSPIVEMDRSSNRSKVAHCCRNRLSIDRKGWRSELVGGTSLGCAILPKAGRSAGKGNPHLAVLNIQLTHSVQRNGTEHPAVEDLNPPQVHMCLHRDYESGQLISASRALQQPANS